MRITGRTHITPRGGVDKARLNSAQHQSWMEAGDQYEPIRTTHAAAFRKEPRQVADVIEHETCENAMKRAIRKWQSLCQIVRDEPNAIPARLATRLDHHPLAEVHRRDPRASRSQADRMPACSAPEIDDVRPANVTEQVGEISLFQHDERIGLVVVDLGPAVIAFLRRERLDRLARFDPRITFQAPGPHPSLIPDLMRVHCLQDRLLWSTWRTWSV